MNSSWNRDYYDVMEFYFWEPQHLGKITNPANPIKTLEDSLNKISKMEVSLNHILNTFFRLCPSCILSEILGDITGNYQLGNVKYQCKFNTEKKYGRGATQADMLLLDDTNIVGIELKLGSKSNIDQIVKYAMLFSFEKEISGKNKIPHLIYLSKSDFPSIFEEKFRSVDELISRVTIDVIPDRTKGGNISLLDKKKDILSVFKRTNLHFTTYSEFYGYLQKIRDKIDLSSKYSDMPRLLLDGLLNELEGRLLI